MKDLSNHAFAYVLNSSLLSPEEQEEFEKFRNEYKNKNKRQISRDILRLKSRVSQDVIDQHIQNLDALAQMQGFVTDETRSNIEYVKRLLSQNTRVRPGANSYPPQQQYVSGTSLLLWFLILAAIW
ncbi:MAG: hypothetical protein N4A57_04770 [Anaeromicrobium sp.]|jgi:hypothetical protein|uniref:hypothetical protein n=1 Tax=Anaeromicrobium sp. TaxID=1929132 RepID=UPI0025D7080E|nr:hypothetical protein [Anaeromicrobium sp.]MCT4593570.1 hypothetical protein [Anaeromicrobium sp.]